MSEEIVKFRPWKQDPKDPRPVKAILGANVPSIGLTLRNLQLVYDPARGWAVLKTYGKLLEGMIA